MIVYADADDLTVWLGEAPDGEIIPLLRKASLLVGRACRNDLYDTTPAGLPADDDLRDAMRDATCSQVEVWLAGGYDPIAGPGGQDPRPTSTQIDGAQVAFDASQSYWDRNRAMTRLAADAGEILRQAGLATAHV